MPVSVEQFWNSFLAENPNLDHSEPYQAWFFSNNSESARTLAELVLSGKKTATASMKAVNEVEPEKAPINGGYSVVTAFEGEPLCVIQTTESGTFPSMKWTLSLHSTKARATRRCPIGKKPIAFTLPERLPNTGLSSTNAQ